MTAFIQIEQNMTYDYALADRPKPANPSYAQIVKNRPVNSQFLLTAIRSFFYINQPAQTADLSSM